MPDKTFPHTHNATKIANCPEDHLNLTKSEVQKILPVIPKIYSWLLKHVYSDLTRMTNSVMITSGVAKALQYTSVVRSTAQQNSLRNIRKTAQQNLLHT